MTPVDSETTHVVAQERGQPTSCLGPPPLLGHGELRQLHHGRRFRHELAKNEHEDWP
jgi:hypothetical protein